MKKQELPMFPVSMVEENSTRLFRMDKDRTNTKIPVDAIRFNVTHESIKTNYQASNVDEKYSMSELPEYELWLYTGSFGVVTHVTKKQLQKMLSTIEEAESMAGQNIRLE